MKLPFRLFSYQIDARLVSLLDFVPADDGDSESN